MELAFTQAETLGISRPSLRVGETAEEREILTFLAKLYWKFKEAPFPRKGEEKEEKEEEEEERGSERAEGANEEVIWISSFPRFLWRKGERGRRRREKSEREKEM